VYDFFLAWPRPLSYRNIHLDQDESNPTIFGIVRRFNFAAIIHIRCRSTTGTLAFRFAFTHQVGRTELRLHWLEGAAESDPAEQHLSTNLHYAADQMDLNKALMNFKFAPETMKTLFADFSFDMGSEGC